MKVNHATALIWIGTYERANATLHLHLGSLGREATAARNCITQNKCEYFEFRALLLPYPHFPPSQAGHPEDVQRSAG